MSTRRLGSAATILALVLGFGAAAEAQLTAPQPLSARWVATLERYQGPTFTDRGYGAGVRVESEQAQSNLPDASHRDVKGAPGFRLCVSDPASETGRPRIKDLAIATPGLRVHPTTYGCLDVEAPASPTDAKGTLTFTFAATQVVRDRFTRPIGGSGTLRWTRAAPTRVATTIPQYRPGGAAEQVFTNAIIDPSVLGATVADDGVFTLTGTCLLPGTTFRADGKELEVLGAPSLKSCDGVSTVKLKGKSFASGRIEASGPNGTAELLVARIGYRDLPPDTFADTLRKLSFALGSPKGQGSLSLGGPASTFPLAGMNEKGVKLDVSDMRKKEARLRFEKGSEPGEATAVLEIDFEKDGRELEGSFLEQLDVFRCGSLTVRTADCSSVDLACFGRVLGGALKSVPSCMSRGAWGPARVDGPNAALSGDLDDAKLTLRIRLGVKSGKVVPLELTPSLTGKLSLSVDEKKLPLSRAEIQERIFAEVNRTLKRGAGDVAIVTPLTDALHALLSVGLGEVMSLSATARGGLWGDCTVPRTPTRER